MKQKLYFLSGIAALIAFTIGLGWHLSGADHADEIVSVPVEDQRPATPSRPRRMEIFPEAPKPKEKPLPDLSQVEKFQSLAREVSSQLATTAIYSDKSRDFHRAPIEVMDSGAELGRIDDVLDAHPELFAEAAKFYLDCAGNNEVVVSVRAVCVFKLTTRARRLGQAHTVRLDGIPEAVLNLANEL